MGRLKLEAEERVETTTVSNLFIDRYMPRANGEYIKIYLLLLRYFQSPEAELSVSALADFLECTEKDVSRGLAYWEREGVVSLRYDGEKKLSAVRLLDLQVQVPAVGETAAACEPAAVSRSTAEDGRAAFPGQPGGDGLAADRGMEGDGSLAVCASETEYKSSPVREPVRPFHETKEASFDLESLSRDEDFSQLLGVVAAYKKKSLSHEDCDILAYLYDSLGMSAELLEYLVEICVENGITSVRTMETIALGWHEQQITTTEQARRMQTICRKDMWKIMRAFGLNGRNPASVERKMMDKWLMQDGFSLEVILEACDRTMRQIQKPNFEYADAILQSWKRQNARSKKDIDALDQTARKAGKTDSQPGASGNGSRGTRSGSRPNRFHNYQQRDTDYDSLIEQHDLLKAAAGSGK